MKMYSQVQRYIQQGFTLIELMIVIAIIGILSAVALAAYQDYLAKSQVTEAMSLFATAKGAVAEYYANHGSWPASNAEAGLTNQASILGKYVASVNIAGGLVDATFKNTDVSGALQGKFLRLSPVDNLGSITWICRFDIPVKLLPRSCSG